MWTRRIVCILSCCTLLSTAAEWIVNPNPAEVSTSVSLYGHWHQVKLPALSAWSLEETLPAAGFSGISLVKEGDTTLRVNANGILWLIDETAVSLPNGARLTGYDTGPVLQEQGNEAATIQLGGWTLTISADGVGHLDGNGTLTLQAAEGSTTWLHKPAGGIDWLPVEPTSSQHLRSLSQRILFPGQAIAYGAETLTMVRPEAPSSIVENDPAAAAATLGSGSFSIRVLADEAAARQACLTAQPPFIVKEDGSAQPWPTVRLEVIDRDGDGPDFDADVWSVTHKAMIRGCLVFEETDAGRRVLLKQRPESEHIQWQVEDWNRDGSFWQGPIFYGGFLQQDRATQPGTQRSFTPYDLDGDGDWDLARWDDLLLFDLGDRAIGCFFSVGLLEIIQDPVGPAGSAGPGIRGPAEPILSAGDGARLTVGGYRHGALFLAGAMKMNHTSETPGATITVAPGGQGADWHDTPSQLVTGLQMRGLGGEAAHDREYDLMLSLSTTHHDLGQGLREERTVTYRDASGHSLSVRSPLVPDATWDGKALTYGAQSNGWKARDQQPWRKLVSRSYPQVHMVFAAEDEPAGRGQSLDFLYDRIEVNPDGNRAGQPITLYYSALQGGLHLKHAKWSHVNARPSSNPAGQARDGSRIAYGAMAAVARAGGDSHGFREWGTTFLAAYDSTGDGYFDVYHLDRENDGAPDRILWYHSRRGKVRFWQPGHLVEWTFDPAFEDVPYLLENRQQLARLYQKGLNHEPLITRLTIDAAGYPLLDGEPLPEATILDESSLKIAGVLTAWGELGGAWQSFDPAGLLRVGSLLADKGYRLAEIDDPVTAARLRDLSLLIIPDLSLQPTSAEWLLVRNWVAQGGKLVMANNRQTAAFSAIAENLLHIPWAVRFSEHPTDAMPIAWERLEYNGSVGLRTLPTSLSRITHYRSPERGLLSDFSYLTYRGRLLNLGFPEQAWLNHFDSPIIAQLDHGEGTILVTDANFLANSSLWSNQPGNDTLRLVDRMLTYLGTRWYGERQNALWRPTFPEQLPIGQTPEAGFQVVGAHNDLLSLKVYPELGGRLMFFGKVGGANQLQTWPQRWNLPAIRAYSPAPMLAAVDPHWGGLETWQDFANWQATGQERRITLSAETGEERLDRVLELPFGRSEVAIQAEALTAHFAVGGSPGSEDVIICPGKDGLQKVPYVLSNQEVVQADPTAGWLAMVDSVAGEAVVVRYAAETAYAAVRLEPNRSMPAVPVYPLGELDPRGGACKLELAGAPGEQGVRWQYLQGIYDVDLVHDDLVLDVMRGGSGILALTVGSAGKQLEVTAKVRILNGAWQTLQLGTLSAGQAKHALAQLDAKAGEQLVIQIFVQDKQVLDTTLVLD